MLKTGIESTAYFDTSDFETGLKKMKSHGYDCMDYQGVSLPDSPFFSYSESAFERYFQELSQCAKETGIEVYQMHGLWPRHSDGKLQVDERDFALYQKELLTAKYLHCKHFVIHPDMPYGWGEEPIKEKAFQRTVETIEKLLPTAKEFGVTLCLENMPFAGGHSFSTIQEVQRVIHTINDEHLRACFDTGHCSVTNESPYESIVALGKDLAVLHIHDDIHKQDRHLVPFQGQIDWMAVIKGLREIKYDGCFSLETNFNRKTPQPALESLQLGLAQLAKWFVAQIENNDGE